jgi:hypothetical protein
MKGVGKGRGEGECGREGGLQENLHGILAYKWDDCIEIER